jgi:beta-glucosidase
LSYTQFEYGKPDVTCRWVECNAKFTVKNIGHVDGDEVVQAYVKTGQVGEPLKALKGFRRVHIEAGKTVDVTLPLPSHSFETFDEVAGELVIRAGTYTVCIGKSSSEADGRCVSARIQ